MKNLVDGGALLLDFLLSEFLPIAAINVFDTKQHYSSEIYYIICVSSFLCTFVY